MSAWIVNKEHIDVLVKARTQHARGFWSADFDADDTGRMLWRENLRSLQGRYPDDVDGTRPGPIGFSDADVDEYLYANPRITLEPGEILKAISCYEYQSCEHDAWEDSDAAKFCRELRDVVATTLWEGPWGWDADEIAKRKGLVTV